jgi:DNA-directed RNA polymerase specialized sigma24 family protein
MGTRTLPVTGASFQKVFAAVVSRRRIRRKSPSGSENAATWREIAWVALERNELGDTFRRAIHNLQDVKNLNTAETAWVLGITVGAVRSPLLRARMMLRNALASGLPSNQECFGA